MYTQEQYSRPLTDEERKILKTFEKVIPNLSEREKDRILYIGEGMALKTDRINKEAL